MTHTIDAEPMIVHSTDSEHAEPPREVFCARCTHEVEPGEATTEVLGSVVHVACIPPAPPCPEGVDPELWADAAAKVCHPPYESAIAWELRLRLFCRLFGPAFARKKAAKENLTK